MNESGQVRQGVVKSLPEVENIKDADLREKVITSWEIALVESTFDSIDDIPCSGNPDWPPIENRTQAHHLRGVANIAMSILDELEKLFGSLDVDRDILLAAALCHDVGKPYEYDEDNQRRWTEHPMRYGNPAVRHPGYGVHIALQAGLPEEVVHVCGAHSREGEHVARSLVCTIVHRADYDFWRILRRTKLLPEF